MELERAIEERHSCREFKSDPLPKEILDKLAHAAVMSPSSWNSQPAHVHFISGERRHLVGQVMALTTKHLEEYMGVLPAEDLRRAERFFGALGGAPVIAVVSVPKDADELGHLNDCLAAGCLAQSIMLAATDLGVGSCCVTAGFWVRDQLAEAACLPADREVAALMVLGYPEGAPVSPPHRTDIAHFVE